MTEHTRWRLVAVLFAAGLLAAAQFGKVSFSLPEMGALYGRSGPAVSFLVSIVGLVGVLFGVVAGSLVASLGARRVLVFCLMLGAGVSAQQALLPGLGAMTALRVAEGVSHLGLVVAAPPLMAQAASDRDRPVVMALWAMFFGVSFALAAVAVPPVLARGGLALLFALHAGAMAAMALVLLPMLPRQERRALRFDLLAEHRRIYTTARLAAPGLGFVFYTVLFVALVTFLPDALGQPSLAALMPLVNLAGTLLAGWLCRRIAPDLVMAGGFAMVAVFTVAMAAGVPGSVLPLFLTMGLVPGAAFAAIPHLNSGAADRARATGAIAQMGNIGTTSGTPIFALFLAHGGIAGLYAGTAAFAIAGLVVVFAMRRRVAQE